MARRSLIAKGATLQTRPMDRTADNITPGDFSTWRNPRPYGPERFTWGRVRAVHGVGMTTSLHPAVVANRASKVGKLRADGIEHCTRIATQFERELWRDVLEAISDDASLTGGQMRELARLAVTTDVGR